MIHKLIYAVNSDDKDILQQYKDRLLLAGIQTEFLKSTDKYYYIESTWDDAELPNLHLKNKNSKRAGAKPKMLQYAGKPVTCGLIYGFRYQKNLSDAEIGSLLNISESTITRRRKKHMAIGSFYEDSEVFFI